jgi:hypothetical protein
MANAFIPRSDVHNWSEDIGNNYEAHQTSLNRLVKNQRRLSRFIERNAAEINPQIGSTTLYLISVVIRIFDLAGGRLRTVSWEQVNDAAKKVSAAADDLFPVDDNFADRLRKIEWRAQPHILDEAIRALINRPNADGDEDEGQLEPKDAGTIFFMMWVVVEALDVAWKPANNFEGESDYTYVDVDA